jgi:hypothetical protein
MDRVVLTFGLIEAGANGTSYNKPQLEALGVPWPPRTGWKEGLVGRSVSASQYRRFLSFKRKERQESMFDHDGGLGDPG